ncbi:hypothetical protein AALP_AA5G262900 [Arabis alpina]|uniref:Uncharacterized protein n=1 Tax=Arabis alpina TaxID=50452 RepID=A0A087GZG4_ARAAL|nr:hypothetical protein AALP_AA5G262900 [Arabis alpina]
MPLPFEGFLSSFSDYKINGRRREEEEEDLCFLNNGGFFSEPTSVLDSIIRSPSPLVSSSTTTLSSSHGGLNTVSAATTFDEMGFEDLLSSSPEQEQSILKLIMSGDVMDEMDPVSDFIGFNTGSGSDPVNHNPLFGYTFPFSHPPPPEQEEKFQIPTNPDFFSVSGSSPPSKRLNSGQPGSVFSNPSQPGSIFSNPSQPGSIFSNPGQSGSVFSDPGQPGSVISDPGHDPLLTPVKLEHNHDQSSTLIIDDLFNAAVELTGTTVHGGDNKKLLAQEILARLNHNLSHNYNHNKTPFYRAALYITEALQSLLLQDSSSSPQTLILKIAAYKAFSETSPFLQFVNFTANQTILESLERFDKIHIVDFDIGYGGQWSSLIQELSGGGGKNRSLKITAFVSPVTVLDEFELRFTEENLRSFAGEVGVAFEIEFLNLEVLLNQTHWPLSLVKDNEVVAVNLPISSVVSSYLPLILRFLKEMSPNVVVCSDRSCDRNNDEPFPNGVIHALQYYMALIESLDVTGDSSNREVERFYVQPSIKRLLMNRYRWMERSQPWRSVFGQCGFSPVMLSQTVEIQAEYLLQRNLMRGFHLEKRQSSSTSLVLCWEKKELVAVSAWKCC